MAIVEKINADIVDAMKSGNKDKLSTLRMTKNALLQEKISLNHELSEDEVIKVLQRQLKQKENDIIEYQKANREDIVLSLKGEISLIKSYLPEEVSLDELNKGLDKIFALVNPTSMKDMGTIMKEVDALFGTRVNKALVSKIIKERLS